ncbi:MAG: helix-turn-helix domain-containing protein [Myxococcota bacterium]|nr:helix-turn-helix domain-containing protein [Myxococcales bacterium]
MQFPRFLTPDETADLLRTTRQAIYAQIRKGTLPGVIRLRRRILIDGQTLLSWLDRNRAVSLQSEGA